MSACTPHPDDDQIVRYVTSDLAETDLTAFEDHLFACDACLARVERYQEAQQVLVSRALPALPTIVSSGAVGAGARPARPLPWWLLGAVAASLVLVAGGVWSRQRVAAPPVHEAAQTAPVVASSPSNVRNAAALRVAVLAMVTPPPYLSITTRGEASESVRFSEAMRAYIRADWVTTARTLATVDTAEARFYQGIADLMRGDAVSATATLDIARKSGIQPYARESVFYLGKAALQRGDLSQAREAFAATLDANASTATEAARLLAALDEVAPGQ